MEIIGEEIKKEEPKELSEDFNFHIDISLFPKTGKFEVKCNIRDLFLAMGLFEIAKDIVKTQITQENNPKIVKPSGGIVNFVRGLKH